MSNLVHKPLAPYSVRGQLKNVTSDTVSVSCREGEMSIDKYALGYEPFKCQNLGSFSF